MTAPTQPISALDALTAMFSQFGLADLAKQIGDLAGNPTLTDSQKYLAVYDLPAYKEAFPAMDALRKQGMVMDEATYISQERAYQGVLTNAGLPKGFYDSKQDFANWILGGVSPNELANRVSAGQRILNNADQGLVSAAQNLYGLDKDHLLAYVIDPNRAQPIIDKQMRAIEAGAAASRNGFMLNQAQAENIATNPLTENLDPATLGQKFSDAGALANSQQRLATIDGTAYNSQEAIDAAVMDNYQAKLASQQRADREAARFSGQSAIGTKTLGAGLI